MYCGSMPLSARLFTACAKASLAACRISIPISAEIENPSGNFLITMAAMSAPFLSPAVWASCIVLSGSISHHLLLCFNCPKVYELLVRCEVFYTHIRLASVGDVVVFEFDIANRAVPLNGVNLFINRRTIDRFGLPLNYDFVVYWNDSYAHIFFLSLSRPKLSQHML